MTNTTIIITETYQDKTSSRKSTKYIIPFTLLGIGIGALVSFLLAWTKVYDIKTIQSNLYAIDEEIKKHQLNNVEIINSLTALKEDAEALQKDLSDVEKKYGKINVDSSVLKINLKKVK